MPKHLLDDDPKARKPNGFLGKGYVARIVENGTLTLGRRDLQKMGLAPGAWVMISVFDKEVSRGEVTDIQGRMMIRPIKAKEKDEEFFETMERERKRRK